MRSLLLIVFYFPLTLLSQNKHVFFAEGGSSSFVPFEKNTNEYRGKNLNSFTFKPSTSAYAKLGLERNFCPQKKFSISLHFGIGFREQKYSYIESGFVQVPYESAFLCYIPWYVNGEKKVSNELQIASLFFGPKLNYIHDKWVFSSALNLNTDYVFQKKFSSEVVSNGETYFYVQRQSKINLIRLLNNLSLQNIIAYKLNSNLSLALSLDVNFLSLDSFKPDNRNWQHLFNTNYGMPNDYYSNNGSPHIYSSIINTGIRLQYSF